MSQQLKKAHIRLEFHTAMSLMLTETLDSNLLFFFLLGCTFFSFSKPWNGYPNHQMDKWVYPTEYSHTNHFLSFTSRAFHVTQSQPVSGMSALWKNGKYCGWFIGRYKNISGSAVWGQNFVLSQSYVYSRVLNCSSLFCNIAALEINRKFQWCQTEVIIHTNNKCKQGTLLRIPLKNRQYVANSTNSIKSRETFRLTESVRRNNAWPTTFLGVLIKCIERVN